MSSEVSPTPIPDPMGRNLPANERVIRGEKWEPDFEPLGQPESTHDDRMLEEEVYYTATSPDDQDIPDAPYYGNPPIGHGRRSHRTYHHRPRHKHHGMGFGWIWILFAFAAWKGLSGDMGQMGGIHFSWWWLLLCWPLWGMMRGLFGSNRGAMATLLIVVGVVFLAQTIGFTWSLILPAALLVVGGLLLLRSIGLFSAA